MRHLSFNKNLIIKLILIFTLAWTTISANELELVNDDELLNLIKTEKYVVILFAKKDCEICDQFENELVQLREDITDILNAWVVKAINSPMVRLYSPAKEPALVYFRHGVPLLYEGPINDEEILHTLTDNKEPIVKELDDNTFEHLTQAATGATTGDWFIMFYSNDCVDCQRLQARWEAVGSKLKTRMNVARVNKGTTGAVTSRRFEIHEVPTFILFRQGRYYRYNIPKYDVASLVSFAQDWYKNAKGFRVPLPLSPFDNLTIAIADYIRDNQWLWQIGLGAVVTGIILALLTRFRALKQTEEQSKTKNEQKDK